MMEKEIDKRGHPRHEIPLSGTIHYRGEIMTCLIRNISASGALLQVDANLRPGHYISVDVPEIGKFGGRVARVLWKHAAMSFEEGKAKVEGFLVEWTERQSKDA